MSNAIETRLARVERFLTNADVLTLQYAAENVDTSFEEFVAGLLKMWCENAPEDIQQRVDKETRTIYKKGRKNGHARSS